LKIGSTLSDIYDQTKSFIVDRDPSLAEKLHKNFGFGIGCDHKEALLEISSTNKTCIIEGGMVFHVRLTLDDS
jgi:nucleosome binding factor SPN SPT16 subunit